MDLTLVSESQCRIPPGCLPSICNFQVLRLNTDLHIGVGELLKYKVGLDKRLDQYMSANYKLHKVLRSDLAKNR